ncbi:MAG: hypothetical protein O3C68_06180, partial [Proteobacteria bacterium]|nr:hypothetical protein [Pseudomonadota bacterium]
MPKTTKPSLFDPPIERRSSDSTKWSRFSSKEHDVIGAWVADMDLPTSSKIIDAVKVRLDERVFGYSEPPDQFFDVVIDRLDKKYGWKTKPEWFVAQPGVVPSLFFASNCLGDTGDGVMAAPAPQSLLRQTAEHTGRGFQPVDCQVNNNRWEMDFDQMRQTISSRTKAFL